jgi:hypothetical protein
MDEALISALIGGLVKMLGEGGPMTIVAGICYFAHKTLIKEKDARLKEHSERSDTLMKVLQENSEAQQGLKSSLDNQSLLLNTLLSAVIHKKRA